MNANQILSQCIAYETDSASPPDGRRVVRDERLKLQSALHTKPADRQSVGHQMTEAARVLKLWRS